MFLKVGPHELHLYVDAYENRDKFTNHLVYTKFSRILSYVSMLNDSFFYSDCT